MLEPSTVITSPALWADWLPLFPPQAVRLTASAAAAMKTGSRQVTMIMDRAYRLTVSWQFRPRKQDVNRPGGLKTASGCDNNVKTALRSSVNTPETVP